MSENGVREEWRDAVAKLAPDERNLDRLIRLAHPAGSATDSLTDPEVAFLAETLANSGARLTPRPTAADVASTGGPGSLTTLLCPLVQVSDGLTVPKLAVPGRPAGGVDTLGSIPGYRTRLRAAAVVHVLETAGYAHFEAADEWAPLDGALFRRRQLLGAQQNAGLVIASLLAKKVAVGLSEVVLDVRVARHGNFGDSTAVAQANADRFVSVARLLGIAAFPVLTASATAVQPAIGRGEAAQALLRVVEQRPWRGPTEWLTAHVTACARMARPHDSADMPPPAADDLRAVLANHLEAQGSSIDALAGYARQVDNDETKTLRADRSGVVTFDLGKIRTELVGEQAAVGHGSAFPDAAGLLLLQRDGATVTVGDELAIVRARRPGVVASLSERVRIGVGVTA